MKTIAEEHLEEVKRLYLSEDKTLLEIALIYGVTAPTVTNFLLKHGIKPLSKSERWALKTNKTKQKIEQYLKENPRSTQVEIANATSMSVIVVRRYLNLLGYQKRRLTSKLENKNRILEYIKQNGFTSRTDIATHLQMSYQKVNNCIKELGKEGLVNDPVIFEKKREIKKDENKKKVLEYIQKNGYPGYKELCMYLQVSPDTLKRYIGELVADGVLKIEVTGNK